MAADENSNFNGPCLSRRGMIGIGCGAAALAESTETTDVERRAVSVCLSA
jgi:hypothetical protein